MRAAAFRPAHALFALAIVFGPWPARADVPRIVRDAVSASVTELQVIGLGDEGSALRWATWVAGTEPGRRAVWLALLRRGRGAPVTMWSATRADGYLPKIQIVFDWYYSGKPTLMFTYQMGAGAEELELYGMKTGDTPVLLGKASAVIFFPIYHDAFFIEAQGALDEPTTCLFFEPAHAELVSKDCPK
jgi:hypothetical protein